MHIFLFLGKENQLNMDLILFTTKTSLKSLSKGLKTMEPTGIRRMRSGDGKQITRKKVNE